MTQSLPPLVWLRAFEAAARHGGFTQAAAELGLTPAAVSHQIRSLEERLGFKLFDRKPRRVELTDIGIAYLPSVTKAFDDLLISTVGLFGTDYDAQLTVRAPVMFANRLLIPSLPRFHALYPRIRLRILAGIWASHAGTTDVEIRFGNGQWDDFDVQPLLKEPSVLVARRDAALADMNQTERLIHLTRHGVVHIMGCEDRWTRILRRHGLSESAIRINMTTDNSLFALELTRAGMGPCIVQKSYFLPCCETDMLFAPLDEGIEIDEAQYLLTPKGTDRKNPAATLFLQWLRQDLGARPNRA